MRVLTFTKITPQFLQVEHITWIVQLLPIVFCLQPVMEWEAVVVLEMLFGKDLDLMNSINLDMFLTSLSSCSLTLFLWTSSLVLLLIPLLTKEQELQIFKMKLKVNALFVVLANLNLKSKMFHGLSIFTQTTICIHTCHSLSMFSKRTTRSAQVLKSGWRNVLIMVTFYSSQFKDAH